MAEVNYPFNTPSGRTRGAAIWANGYIAEPGTGDSTSATAVRNGIERLSETLYFLGTGGVSDYYVLGNGDPPTAGYTPTTRPIEFKGSQGLKMSAPFEWGPLATSAGYPPESFGDVGDASTLITVTALQYRCAPPVGGNRITRINVPAPEPPTGHVWTVTFWQPADVTGNTRSISYAGGQVIVTFPADTHCAVMLSYYNDTNRWVVTGSVGATLVNPS